MQKALTVFLKVKPGQETALRMLLCDIGTDIRGNPYLRFPEFERIHFARFVLLDQDTRLLFTTTYDGELDPHLQEFLDRFPNAVELIFGKCEGFPDPQAAHYAQQFKTWIDKQSVPASAFFKAYPGMTVKDTHDSIALRKQICAMLDTTEAETLIAQLATLAQPPMPKENILLKLISTPVNWALGQIVPLVLFFIAPHMSKERTTKASSVVRVPYEITERESIVQNELTIIAKIRPERLGQLKNVLKLIEFGCRLPGDGTLSGVSTIHFARWVIYDQDSTLLFESNYDGAWESYIGEFIDRAALGLDSIWGCCEDYPERGAKDATEFKRTIINHQVRAEVFYSAYPKDSVKNILNDLAIVKTMKNAFAQPVTAEFLRRL